jgi:hypothetical protein
MRRFTANRSLSVEARTRNLEDWAVAADKAASQSSRNGTAGSGQAGLSGVVPPREPPGPPVPSVYAVRTITANDTATTADGFIKVDTTAGNVTLTLPTAASMKGRVLIVKKISTPDVNLVTLDGNGAETIDGATTYVFNIPLMSVSLISDGAAWWLH